MQRHRAVRLFTAVARLSAVGGSSRCGTRAGMRRQRQRRAVQHAERRDDIHAHPHTPHTYIYTQQHRRQPPSPQAQRQRQTSGAGTACAYTSAAYTSACVSSHAHAAFVWPPPSSAPALNKHQHAQGSARPSPSSSFPPFSALALRWLGRMTCLVRAKQPAGVKASAWLCSGPDSSDTGAAVLALVIYEESL